MNNKNTNRIIIAMLLLIALSLWLLMSSGPDVYDQVKEKTAKDIKSKTEISIKQNE